MKDRKISGMKSHDCHIFLQKLLPIAIRGFLPEDVAKPLIELSAFFRDICSKCLDMSELDRLEKQIPLILCKLETIFPPSFFDIMVHLTIYLVYEAMLAGPVQYRWMYFVERDLHKKKLFVRNKAKPKGSIAEAYIAYECLTFCSRYLVGIETIFNQPPRNDDGVEENGCDPELSIFKKAGRPLGRGNYRLLSDDWKLKAHLYILNNCEEVWPYIEMYKRSLPNMNPRQLMKQYNSEFPKWFSQHINELHEGGKVSKDLFHLASGPYSRSKHYSAYIVNGFRFHTYGHQNNRNSQNSGVLARGDDNSSEKEYYGTLIDVLEIQYSGSNCVYLFQCEWFDVHRKGSGYTVDNFSITSVNSNARLNTDEPFILATQAEQVFYVQDPKKPNWLIVMKNQPRDLYNLPSRTLDDNDEISEEDEVFKEEEATIEGHAITPLDDDTIDKVADLVDFEEMPLDIVEQIQKNIDANRDVNENGCNESESEENTDDIDDVHEIDEHDDEN